MMSINIHNKFTMSCLQIKYILSHLGLLIKVSTKLLIFSTASEKRRAKTRFLKSYNNIFSFT